MGEINHTEIDYVTVDPKTFNIIREKIRDEELQPIIIGDMKIQLFIHPDKILYKIATIVNFSMPHTFRLQNDVEYDDVIMLNVSTVIDFLGSYGHDIGLSQLLGRFGETKIFLYPKDVYKNDSFEEVRKARITRKDLINFDLNTGFDDRIWSLIDYHQKTIQKLIDEDSF